LTAVLTPGLVLIPGLVHLPVPSTPSPGMGGVPLRASEIQGALDEVIGQFVGSKVDQSLFHSVRHRLAEILFYQFGLRGLPSFDKTMASVPMEIDVVTGSRIVVRYGPLWNKDVDERLGNRDCRRCGGLLTSGFVHTGDECDLVLARGVLES
jgi:hypothetical protein